MKPPKMKIKIVYKLFAFFTAVLFIFMLILNGFFYFFFNKQTVELRRNDLREKVGTIANTISMFLQNDAPTDDQQPSPSVQTVPPHENMHMHMGMSGTAMPYYRALVYYIKLLNRMDMSDIWLINDNHQFLISNNRHHHPVQYNELPTGGVDVINEALQGNIVVADSFSGVLGTPATTAAAPIRGADGSYVGAVLMHVPLNEVNNSIFYAIRLLIISSLFAMVISLPASLLVSYYCTEPLRKMKTMALSIAEGNYATRAHVHQSDEIGDLASSLDQMAVRLDAAAKESGRLDKARRIFIANVSHELRTPVTVLRASLEALTNGLIKDDVQQKEYHQQMLNETIYLERLVNDMLELSKLQNPDFKIEMTKFILNDLVNDASRSMRPFAAAKQIHINTNIELPPAQLIGDYGRLRQMLMIVIDNAIKFSQKNDFITIHLYNKPEKKSTAFLSISDNGCGIDPTVLPHIFDRFHKTNDERNKKGTGLGLAIAKQIALHHDIEIKIDSILNKGATFTFSFKDIHLL